jgi:C-terminal region of aryl-sulfatase/Sulfatase
VHGAIFLHRQTEFVVLRYVVFCCLRRLRDHVPLDCTACPQDYTPRPTSERPRRCQLWQPPLASGTDVTDDAFFVDGVHCGDDSGLGSVWEANLRMPTLIAWPGHVVANTTTSATVSSLDIAPTILSLAGLNDDDKENRIALFDGLDISSVLLGKEDEYDSDGRVLFFWRDGFLLDLSPLGPPYGRFDVVAVKVGRYKAWYWTKSAHYNADVEQYHNPPLLFDVLQDPAEANPIVYRENDETDFFVQLVKRLEGLVQLHKSEIVALQSYPLTLHRDARYIPCADASRGCRTTSWRTDDEVLPQATVA